jgi:ABC-type proline/glycine betaine transport system ATPase subunit
MVADRIAVLERGRIVQQGTRDELRAAPSSPFVAGFAAPPHQPL